MKLRFSFTIDTFENPGRAFSLMAKYMNSQLTAISANFSYTGGGDWINTYEEVVQSLESGMDTFFQAHDGKDIHSVIMGDVANSISYLRDPNYKIEVITVAFVEESAVDINNLLRECAILKFNTAQKFDYYKARWQSEQFPNNFRAVNKSYEDKRLISHPMWTKKIGLTINIRENPGRDISTYNMHLMAAPEMWFGPGCWAFFKIENILNCKQLLKVKEILPGVVYVKLFEPDAEDYETPQILAVQRSFRDCSKMDEVEELLNNRLAFPPGY